MLGKHEGYLDHLSQKELMGKKGGQARQEKGMQVGQITGTVSWPSGKKKPTLPTRSLAQQPMLFS